MTSKRDSDTNAERELDCPSKRSKDDENIKASSEDPLILFPPPLRTAANCAAPFVVGRDLSTRIADDIENRFAEAIFTIKINALETHPKRVVEEALSKEELSASNVINSMVDGSCEVVIFVEGVKVARGISDSSGNAETEAYEDFIER